MQGQFFRKVGWGGQRFSVGLMKVFMGLPEDCGLQALALILSRTPSPKTLVGGALY